MIKIPKPPGEVCAFRRKKCPCWVPLVAPTARCLAVSGVRSSHDAEVAQKVLAKVAEKGLNLTIDYRC